MSEYKVIKIHTYMNLNRCTLFLNLESSGACDNQRILKGINK